MLKSFRSVGMKKIIWIIIIAIIAMFGLGGSITLFLGNSDQSPGKVFGKKVSSNAFRTAYQNVQILALMTYGDDFSRVKSYLDLEAQTWDRIILMQEVKKHKIKISDADVVTAIQSYPFFKRNEQFDTLLYNDMLRYVFGGISPRDFEENIREVLKIQNLRDQQTTESFISETSLMDSYKTKNEKVKVSYAIVPSKKYEKNVTVSEKNAEEYYLKHKLEFLEPETINTRYITLMFPETPEEETEDLSETPSIQDSTEAESDMIRSTFDKIYNDLAAGINLTDIATNYKLPLETSGFFSKDNPNYKLGWSLDLLQQIFETDPGDFTEPFETSKSITIVEVVEKKEAFVPTYKQAQNKIHNLMKSVESKKIAQSKTQSFAKIFRTSMNTSKNFVFAKSAKNLQLKLLETPVFTRGQYLPKIGISEVFQQAAFSLTKESPLSDAVEIENGFCVLYLDEFIAIDPIKFEEEKETLKQTLLEEQKNKDFSMFLSELRKKANITITKI